jgi:hypothetical protein
MKSYNSGMKNLNFTKKYTDRKTINSNNCAKFVVNWPTGSQFTARHTKNHRVIGIDGLTVCILYGEILNFHSRVVGLYSSNCRRFFVCRAVNWEPLGQFTSNFALKTIIFEKSVKTINSNNSTKFEVNWRRGFQFTVRHTKNRLQFDE